MHRIILRYIIREISQPFFLILFILTFVLLMGRILQLMDLMINKGISLFSVLKLILYLMPSFLVITIPVSLLISILIGLGRMSGDNEITVMKSSGLSLYQLVPPVAVIAAGAFIATALMGFFLVPGGNFATKTLLFEIARQKASIGIKEKVFNDDFAGLVLYADSIPVHGDFMEGIFIYDSRTAQEPMTIIANRGYLVSNPESLTVTLRLEKGSTHTVGQDLQHYKKMEFSSYNINLDISQAGPAAGGGVTKDSREMSLTELAREIGKTSLPDRLRRELVLELNHKFTIPLSCLVFGILGIPLGIVRQRSGKSRGFVVGLCIVMIYYVLQLSGEALGETGRISPVIGAWGPNLILGILGIHILIKTAREEQVIPVDTGRLMSFITAVKGHFGSKGQRGS